MHGGKGITGGQKSTLGSGSGLSAVSRSGANDELKARLIQRKTVTSHRIEGGFALQEKVLVLKQRYVELGDKESRLAAVHRQLASEVINPQEARIKNITERLAKFSAERLKMKELLAEMEAMLSQHQTLSKEEEDLLNEKLQLTDLRAKSRHQTGKPGVSDADFDWIDRGLAVIQSEKINIEKQLETRIKEYELKLAEG